MSRSSSFTGTGTSTFKCPPQLPRKLLRELARNPVVAGQPVTILQSIFDELRYKIALRTFPVDHLWQIEGSPCQQNLLQIAANIGDLPLAYEMIRLGANLNTTDQYGRTSLFHAVQILKTLALCTEEPQFYPVPNNYEFDTNMGQRIEKVACLLI
ncbi:hypothetical protein BD410DRAFT_838273 [Rickenella mellea]|uniref:Uncharacterized protein n=1 Tax=Rickenella mellea TaxID=50990 RepID=A0A4Y7Q9T9_9AGAM|nr:hypothetical protein BD410DRAFT_838273 [Rickenella mellea]